MEPPPLVLAATAAVDLFAAILFLAAFLRRRTDREHGLAMLVGIAAALHATGRLLGARARASFGAIVAARAAGLGLLLALPFMVHFALAYRGGRVRWQSLAVLYAATAGVGALMYIAPGIRMRDSVAIGLRAAVGWDHVPGSAAGGGPLVQAAAVAAATYVLVAIAREFLAGKRGALVAALGATILLATALNDLGVSVTVVTTGYLADPGLAVFVAAIATTPSARYAVVASELERRSQELRTQTRELQRSYEELSKAQEELVKKEQLAVVGELAAVIAHEVRNPLAIIGNAVAGLRKQAISRDDHEVLLSILDEEANRLNRLVTDLLRYARPVNLQRSHLALEDLLERALALVNTGAKSIRMELSMEASAGRMWGDANLLRQVFDNLIDNAVQAMSTGGSLTVRVRAETDDGTDGLAVDIIDTGEGMDTQVRSRALDPFFTTRPSGTGLGLAIVDRIVDAHGGRLSIESRAGEGTTVTVFLPHGSPSEPPPALRSRVRGVSDASA